MSTMQRNISEIQSDIKNVQDNQINMMKVQMLQTQNTMLLNQEQMKYDINSLKKNQNIRRQDIVSLDKKLDKNHEKLTKRLDENLYEISAMFQEVHNKIDEKNKKKVAILKKIVAFCYLYFSFICKISTLIIK